MWRSEALNTFHYDCRVKAFEDLAPIEVADEMTLIEFEMFKKIKEREFLNLSWKNVKDHKAARNIKRMVERVNKARNLIAHDHQSKH